MHAEEWPSRAWLARIYRALDARSRLAEVIDGPLARAVLEGEGRSHPLGPEASARASRVLAELGLLRWQRSGDARSLSVVSSSATDLERSAAFLAYRERYEDGKRFLSRAPTPS